MARADPVTSRRTGANGMAGVSPRKVAPRLVVRWALARGPRTRCAVGGVHRSGPLGVLALDESSQDPDHSVALWACFGKRPELPRVCCAHCPVGGRSWG